MNNGNCSNCGHVRADMFCAHCGQNDRNYQRAFPPMVWDLARETFDLDSRVFRTIGYLLFKPGELALEFSRNRRASYVSPIRLYLFVSLCFFFLLSFNTEFEADLIPEVDAEQAIDTEGAADKVAAFRAFLSTERQAKIDEILTDPEPTIRKQIVVEIARGVKERDEPLSGMRLLVLSQIIDATYDPRMLVPTFMDNLPIAMFMLLPFFALILSIIYYKRHRYYVENLVFATHLHTFAFLIYIVLLLLPRESSNAFIADVAQSSSTLLILVLLVYHLASLKRYYGEGYFRTGSKYVLQMALYFILLIPTAVIAVTLFTLATV